MKKIPTLAGAIKLRSWPILSRTTFLSYYSIKNSGCRRSPLPCLFTYAGKKQQWTKLEYNEEIFATFFTDIDY